MTEAVGQVNQRSLPAPDDPFKGGNVAGQNPFDIGLIVGGAHSRFCLNGMTLLRCGRLHYFKNAFWTKKMQPELREAGPT